LVIVTSTIDPESAGTGWASFSVDGTTTTTTLDPRAVIREHGGSSDTGLIQASTTSMVTGLSAGSHAFAMSYRTNGSGTNQGSSFSNRSITVIPLG
jgi:hypothetical protein